MSKQPADKPLRLEDGRNDLPIFIHSELDDLPLTLEAFRVYAHLARRAGKSNDAWPSYNSIGETCFRRNCPNASKETIRKKAIDAVKELVSAGLIAKIVTKSAEELHSTNSYILTPRSKWESGALPLPPSLPEATPWG